MPPRHRFGPSARHRPGPALPAPSSSRDTRWKDLGADRALSPALKSFERARASSTDVKLIATGPGGECSPYGMRSLLDASDRTPGLAQFLELQGHAFTRDSLIAQWSRYQLDAAMRRGSVVRVLPGIYAGVTHRHDAVVRGEGLNMWAPRGLVTGELAVHLYAPQLRCPRSAHLVVSRGDRMNAPQWLTVHQTGPLYEYAAPRGVRCTTPERALLDAWRFADPSDRRGLLYEALWAGLCTWKQLERELLRAQRVAGRRDLERILGWFACGSTSPLELMARRDVFRGHAFDELEWQVKLECGSRRIVADALHRRAKVVVEFDGARFHATAQAVASDRERDIDLAAAGYLTVRFGWDDVAGRPAWCRERLLKVVAARR